MPHILVVDDDRECLLALSNRLKFAFRQHTLKVDKADSAATGLILAHEGHYDALIIDMMMPGMTGLKFVEQLRRTQPKVPIVMMSGWDLRVCEEQAAPLGLTVCLQKPIEFVALVGVLVKLLGLETTGFNAQREGSRRPHGSNRPRVRMDCRTQQRVARYSQLNVDDPSRHTS